MKILRIVQGKKAKNEEAWYECPGLNEGGEPTPGRNHPARTIPALKVECEILKGDFTQEVGQQLIRHISDKMFNWGKILARKDIPDTRLGRASWSEVDYFLLTKEQANIVKEKFEGTTADLFEIERFVRNL